MTGSDAATFIARFTATWRDPQPGTFAELFTEDGTLLHPTMSQPIGRDEVPDYVRRLTSLVPDLTLDVLNWASSGTAVLIEWELTGTFNGQRTTVNGADRFTLRGDRAVEGVAYFDTAALWALLDPSAAPTGHLLDVVDASR